MDPWWQEASQIIVTALSLGVADGVKQTASQAVRDAYARLKEKLSRDYDAVDVTVLEKDPKSEKRQALVKEELEATTAPQDEQVIQLAQQVILAVQMNAPETIETLGLRIEDVQVIGTMNVEDIVAQGGADFKNVRVGGDMNVRNLRLGGAEGDPPKKA